MRRGKPYFEFEGPVLIQMSSPTTLEQTVDDRGNVAYTSNDIQQLETVDPDLSSFI